MIHPTTNDFTLIGINHWDAPVEVREKFSLDESQKRLFLDAARREGIQSIFIVSTCNRTEAYLYGRPADARRVEAVAVARHGGTSLGGRGRVRDLTGAAHS